MLDPNRRNLRLQSRVGQLGVARQCLADQCRVEHRAGPEDDLNGAEHQMGLLRRPEERQQIAQVHGRLRDADQIALAVAHRQIVGAHRRLG